MLPAILRFSLANGWPRPERLGGGVPRVVDIPVVDWFIDYALSQSASWSTSSTEKCHREHAQPRSDGDPLQGLPPPHEGDLSKYAMTSPELNRPDGLSPIEVGQVEWMRRRPGRGGYTASVASDS